MAANAGLSMWNSKVMFILCRGQHEKAQSHTFLELKSTWTLSMANFEGSSN